MTRLLSYFLLFSFTCFLACQPAPKASLPQSPNLIVFLVDDMGWQDTSVPFWTEQTPQNNRFHTPNMERMAAEGMKFTQAYAHSVCSPTRVSLLSGMSPLRHRVTNWTLHQDGSQEPAHPSLTLPDWNVGGLQASAGIPNSALATPLPQLLQDSGYFTIHVGKAHFGAIGTPGAEPLNLGFDRNIAGHAAGAPGSYQGQVNFGNDENGQPRNVWSVPGLEAYHGQDINLTEVLTQEAIQAMNEAQQAEKPFFLYMAHYTIHTPIQPDHRYFESYLAQGLDTIEARYASMVEGMDQSLGDILTYLDEQELAEETVILFMSDNGGLSAHARGGGPAHRHNWPLNSGKGSAYEGGIREPMLARWPGHIEAGSTCDDYLIIEDFYPSLLELAGIDSYETAQTIDGVSFVPLLTQSGNPAEGRSLFWHYPNHWGPIGPGIGATSTVRQGDWKLIYSHTDQRLELFNLSQDLGETNDLSRTEPTKRKELAAQLGHQLRAMEAQMPRLTATDQAIPWPDSLLTTILSD